MGLHGSAGYSSVYANTGRKRQTCKVCDQRFFEGSNNFHTIDYCPNQCPQCKKPSFRRIDTPFRKCLECGYNRNKVKLS